MGDIIHNRGNYQQRRIIACPLCGENLQELPKEHLGHCPSCEFNLDLLASQETSSLPQSKLAFVPRLAFWLIGVQIISSGLFVGAFLFFAAPLYFGTPQLIATIQLVTLIALGLFAFFLSKQKGITVIRFGLVIVGVISLPPGVCAIAAALAISPLKRTCVICGEAIKWVAYLECPHCQASMHRWGSCRKQRLRNVMANVDSETKLSQLEFICPSCRQLMNLNQNRGEGND